MRIFWLMVAAIVGLSLLAGVLVWSSLPDKIAVHWGLSGQPNGWMDKGSALWALPVVMLLMAVLMDFLPRLDPRNRHVESFRAVYEQFILVMLLFMAALHLTTLSWAVGLAISPLAVVSVGLAAVFFFVGRLCAASQPNYFIGIRTPWALEDDEVWRSTNRLASRLYTWAAPVCLLGLLLPDWSILFILLAAVGPSLLAVAYSYLLYQKRHSKKGAAQPQRAKRGKKRRR